MAGGQHVDRLHRAIQCTLDLATSGNMKQVTLETGSGLPWKQGVGYHGNRQWVTMGIGSG
ncbi:hypothetical protein DPMN_147941 [Dreissena polymorpha]|uniref:Uncharacterized protein n=1 Tax=Dreissena polymorpha TaxID=45954 RepID=A0A9D4F944_DREPO|nr:hypothetical protein DPMN_147941 [Dreissena polymorpha]